MSYIFKRSK